jgi:hypothetical protein
VGQFLRYRVSADKGKVKVSAPESKKTFAKKNITYIEAFPLMNTLLSVCDGYVCLHRLDSVDPIVRIEKSKGVSCVAAQVQWRRDATYNIESNGPLKSKPTHELVLRIAMFGVKKAKVVLCDYIHGDPDVRDMRVRCCRALVCFC